jgi:hypothetical protein
MMEQKVDAVSFSGEQTRLWNEIMEENSSCLLNCLHPPIGESDHFGLCVHGRLY